MKATLDLLIVFVDYSETNSGQATPNLPVGSGSPSGSGKSCTYILHSSEHTSSTQTCVHRGVKIPQV